MRRSSRIVVNLVSGLVECPSEEKIVVPLRAVLTTKRPQQQKRKNGHFEQSAAVRASDVHASTGWATPKKIETSSGMGTGFGPRMLTRPQLRVNAHGETQIGTLSSSD
jgi:hypothetical protein